VTDLEANSQVAQQSHPRPDPGLVGRRVEHAVELTVVPATHQVHEDGLAHVADRAGARHRRLRGHKLRRHADPEALAVLGRHALRADEVPPALVLPLAEPTFVAAREEDEQPLGEVLRLVRRDAPLLGDLLDEDSAQSVDRERLPWIRDRAEELGLGAAVRTGRLHVGSRHEVVPDAVRVAGEGDAPHRVGHVVIEARKEPEPVLAGKRSPAAPGRSRHADAPCLAAERLALVDRHLESPLRQLVGGRKATHSPAEHGDLATSLSRPAPGGGLDRYGRRGQRGRRSGDSGVSKKLPARQPVAVAAAAGIG
jgi:hypothetical protein